MPQALEYQSALRLARDVLIKAQGRHFAARHRRIQMTPIKLARAARLCGLNQYPLTLAAVVDGINYVADPAVLASMTSRQLAAVLIAARSAYIAGQNNPDRE
ncbi:MAG: hypothetical protein ACRDAJ_06890 [Serratia fonticola]